MEIRQTLLANGLRIVTASMPGFRTTVAAIGVRVGSRHETPEQAGLSHLLEHILFKGTERYPTAQIINESVDSVGGDNNACTTEEHTMYHIKVPGRHSRLALDILCDMVRYPLLDPEELDLERGPVIEEMNNDAAETYVYDMMPGLLYPNHALGRPVIGSRQVIETVSREVVWGYFRKHYQPRNMVVSVAGLVDHDSVVEQVAGLLGGPSVVSRQAPTPLKNDLSASPVRVLAKDTAQAHVLLGLRSLSVSHTDLPALYVLDSVLGTGMSSRLFSRIRERQGLAYSVYSMAQAMTDTGVFYAYVGAGLEKADRALDSLVRELMLTTREPVLSAELNKAKQLLIAGYEQVVESNQQVGLGLCRDLLQTGRISTIDDEIARTLAVTAEDVQRVASEILVPANMRLAVVAPAETCERLSRQFQG